MSKITIDPEVVAGRLSAAMVNPESTRVITEAALGLARFLSGEVPSHYATTKLLTLFNFLGEEVDSTEKSTTTPVEESA